MPESELDRTELLARLRQLRGELARAFDQIPYCYPADEMPALRWLADTVESELSELIALLD